jgi:hypothetical protein
MLQARFGLQLAKQPSQDANATICRHGSHQPIDLYGISIVAVTAKSKQLSTNLLSPRGKLAFEPRSLVAVASKTIGISTTVAKKRPSAPSRQASDVRRNVVWPRHGMRFRGADDHVRQYLDVRLTTPTLPKKCSAELNNRYSTHKIKEDQRTTLLFPSLFPGLAVRKKSGFLRS